MSSRASFVAQVSAVLALLSAEPANALDRPRIAIIARGDGTIDQPSLDRLVTLVAGALLRTAHFDVVDRSRLSAIIAEQGFSNSAYADPKSAAALGKIAGASRLLELDVTLEASNSDGPYVRYHTYQAGASYTLVGVDSGKILAAGSASGVSQAVASAGASGGAFGQADQQSAFRACADDLASQLDGAR